MPFASIREAIEDIRAGRMLVVVDDEDRENEGDLTVAAEAAKMAMPNQRQASASIVRKSMRSV